MTKKTRTILFFICLVLFLVIAPLVVFYSMGYRFDFDSQKIVKTGGLYFKVWPKEVQIYVNGKLKKRTDFFFGSVLIESLLPKKHEIEIKKSGYHSWKKTLQIEEEKVTEFKNVFLIPENPVFNDLGRNVDAFWPSQNEEKLILKEVSEDGWSLEIIELGREVKTHLFDEKDFKKEKEASVEILDLKFSPDSKQILLKIEEDKEEKNFILSIEEIPINLISLDFLGNDIRKISFNPRSPQTVFFSNGDGLFEIDILTKEKSQILKKIITHEVSEENIYFISNDGFLFKTDLSGVIQEKLSSEAIILNDEARYQIHPRSKEILLLENDIVYILDKNSEKFEKLFEGIGNFKISADLKKIFFSSRYEIWILFLEEILDQPSRKVKEKLFLTRFSEEIDKGFWYTSNYLIFNAGPKIKVAEIDDRDQINIVDLVEFTEPKIFFNRVDKKLYILTENNLLVSKKLLP